MEINLRHWVAENRWFPAALMFVGLCTVLFAADDPDAALEERMSAAQAEVDRVWELEPPERLKRLNQYLEGPEIYPGYFHFVQLTKIGSLIDSDPRSAVCECDKFIPLAATAEERIEYRMQRVIALQVLEQWDAAITEQLVLLEEPGDEYAMRSRRVSLASIQLEAQRYDDSLATWNLIEAGDIAGGHRRTGAEDNIVFGKSESLLNLNRAEEALSLLSANLPQDQPTDEHDSMRLVRYLTLRSRLYQKLGMDEAAAADLDTVEDLKADVEAWLLSDESGPRKHPFSLLPTWTLVIPLSVIWAILLFAASKQRSEEGGTWTAYLGVTLGLACLTLLPCVPGIVSYRVWGIAQTEDRVVLVIAAVFFCIVFAAIFLKRPMLQVQGQAMRAFPELEDPDTLAAIQDLSQRMGVRPPKARHIPGVLTLGTMHAQVSGLVATTVIVDLDLLHRMTAGERNAVMAHELAHIKNHSLGICACVWPVALTLAIISVPADAFFLAIAWGALCGTGLWKIVSQRLEYDCDSRAATLCGPREMASALVKIHAVLPIRSEGWASLLAYATQTHPSREQRLAALAERFPDAGWDAGVWSPQRRRQQTMVGWIACLSWLSLLLSVVFIPRGTLQHVWTILYTVAMIIPSMLFNAAIRHDVKQHQKRLAERSTGGRVSGRTKLVLFLLGMLSSVAGLSYVSRPTDGEPWWSRLQSTFQSLIAESAWVWLYLIGAITVLYVMIRRSNNLSTGSKLSRRIGDAVIDQDWALAVEIAEENSHKIRADYAAAHDAAVAKWMLGWDDEALADLSLLWETYPERLQTGMTLWAMHSDREDWPAILTLMDEYQQRAPEDSLSYTLRASAHMRMQRVDEARVMLKLAEENGEHPCNLHSIETGIEMVNENWEAARSHLDQADALSPGGLRLRLLRVELEILAGHPEDAGPILDQAERQIAAMPMELVQRRTARLRSRWNAAMGQPSCDDSEVWLSDDD